MLISSRLSTIIYGFKLLLSISLLLAKFNLLAVPIATLVTGVLQRLLARHYLLRNLPEGVRMDPTDSREILRHVWPSSWRLGITLLSLNVMVVGFGLIIDRTQGLAGVPPYHFSQQILYGVCVSMATVWTFVKWPQICLQRASGDFAGLQRVVWQRLWLQCLTYVGLAALFIVLGPPLLKWVAPDKQLLPRIWLVVLALYAFLDMHYGFWTTLISTENRIPSMWAAVITNLSTLGLAWALAKFTDVGWGAFVIAPLACGVAFNYWFWPGYGARGIGATWLKLMFHGPSATASSSHRQPSVATA
jgi:Na+-driven multidrug efflux pump